MKKKLLSLLCFLPGIFCQAQVDNYCLRLSDNGQVDCGAMPELDKADNYSLQFWMNPDKWSENATLISRGDGFRVQLGKPHTLNFSLGNQTFTVNSSDLAIGKWAQVTLLVQAEEAKVLVNKENVKTRTSVGGTYELMTEGSSFTLGGDLYNGRLDEIRVWNRLLKPDYDYFINTTLNKWTPQLRDLVAYYKLDQKKCPEVVDYRYLFRRLPYNHHGILSDTGAKKELVTDNDKLPYLLCGAYTDNPRFMDRGVDKEKYLLANDLIILGLQSYADGHVKAENTNDHAKVRGKGAEYLETFKRHDGVLALTGDQYLYTTKDVLYPEEWRGYGYTFETWVHLDKWTEGAYFFKKLTRDGKQGFSISLGAEATHEIIITVDGRKFVVPDCSALALDKWVHFGVSTYGGSTPDRTFFVCMDNTVKWPDSKLSDNSSDVHFTGVGSTIATIGEGLCAKLDETAVWNGNLSSSDLSSHKNNMPMPGLGKAVSNYLFQRASARYAFDNPEELGWDSYSQDEWRNIMLSAYKGYSGYQVRISVRSHEGWQKTISDANKRAIFARDLAYLSRGYDGVELDLEWMDGTQTNLGLLAKEIRKRLPKDKSLMVSCHAYGAYRFPYDAMNDVDGFTFQQYGPQNTFYSLSSYINSYNSFVNYGFPKKKIYLSYASTTSGPYDANGHKKGWVIEGWRSLANMYKPNQEMGLQSLKMGDNYYYFQSPEQVYARAKFAVENNIQGIFYWDMGNDVATNSRNSLARSCNFGLNSNVDPLVTEVVIKHPTSVDDVLASNSPLHPVYSSQGDEVSLEGSQTVLSVSVYGMDGRKVAQVKGHTVSLSHLSPGAYILKPVLAKGKTSISFVVLKK